MKNIAKWLVVGLFATIICTTAQGAESLDDIEKRQKEERQAAALRAMNEHIKAERMEKENAKKERGQLEQLEQDAQEIDERLMAAGLQASLEEVAQEEAKRAPTEKREEYVFPQARIDNPDRQLLIDQQLYGQLVQLKYRLKAAKTKEQAEKIVNYSRERINELLAKGANPRAIMLGRTDRPVSIIDIATDYFGRKHPIVNQLEGAKAIHDRMQMTNAQKERERDKRWGEGQSGAKALKEEQNKLPGGLANLVKGFAQPSWTDKDVEIYSTVIPSHNGKVAISPDGNFIVTVSESDDNSLKVWNNHGAPLLNAAGEQVVLSGHTDEIYSLKISADGRFIVTGSFDGTARIWDAQTGQLLRILAGHTGAVALAISVDGRFIVTASADNGARIWNAQTGVELRMFARHASQVPLLAISADGRFVVTGSRDGTARISDAQSGELVYRLAGHTRVVHSVAISRDGKFIVTGSLDGTARIWDAQTGQWLRTLADHTGPVYSVAISTDDRFIVTGSLDGTARIWNAQTGQLLHTLAGHNREVTSVAISPDGKFIVTGSADKIVRIWDAQTGVLLHTLAGHTGPVGSVAISTDGRFIVTGSWDNTTRIWRLRQY